jgi:argininosuccinate lyase
MTKLWGGRFSGGQDPVFESFHRSLSFDRRLVDEDVRGSVAWANALADAGVLTAAEAKKIVSALAKVAKDDPSLLVSPAEDVHSYVEARLGVAVATSRRSCTPVARATTRSRRTCASGRRAPSRRSTPPSAIS